MTGTSKEERGRKQLAAKPPTVSSPLYYHQTGHSERSEESLRVLREKNSVSSVFNFVRQPNVKRIT